MEHVCRSESEAYVFNYGPAIEVCWSEGGRLFVTTADEEYGSQVRFCPWCGVAAEVTEPLQDGQRPTRQLARDEGKVWN